MNRVLIESPYYSPQADTLQRNIYYARKCVKDSLNRGEAPFASHLLYTQNGILQDTKPHERELGISAGLLWGEAANITAVYGDCGYSEGMMQGIGHARKNKREVVYRTLEVPNASFSKLADLQKFLKGLHVIQQKQPGHLSISLKSEVTVTYLHLGCPNLFNKAELKLLFELGFFNDNTYFVYPL